MLVEIYSPVFKEKGQVRPPIQFKNGLNVIQGTSEGANSIGKSSALLAIDFVFGGNTYIKSDGVKYLGNHTVYFCFEFDKKYYFGRNTKEPETITICSDEYIETNETLKNTEFLEFLLEKYKCQKTTLTFRKLISTYFRIYGKDNVSENHPLANFRNQSSKDSIKSLICIFNMYQEISAANERLETANDKLKVFRAAKKTQLYP